MNLLKFRKNKIKKETFIKKYSKRYNFYISSSLKNTPSNSGSSRDKLTISLSFNDKSSPAISHNLVSSSLYFEEFLERRRRLLWT